jgi:hypothetical protein
MTLLLALLIVTAVISLAGTAGVHAARRAEAHIGAWAWMLYLFLGIGMIFGARTIDHTLLSTFMWTKLTVFILTGCWLLAGRVRRREALFPMAARGETA